MATRKRKIDPTGTFEQYYLDAVAAVTTPAKVLTLVALDQLQAEGIDAHEHQATIEKALGKALEAGETTGETSFQFETGDPRIDRVDLSIKFDEEAVEAAMDRLTKAVMCSTEGLVPSLRKTVLRSVLQSPEDQLTYVRNEQEAFARRLHRTWRRPFDLLDIHLEITREAGAAWAGRFVGRRMKKAPLVNVIIRLHARSLLVASEVRALLMSGFADGALSRWRTIHELAVVAFFVQQEGIEVAKRYLDHLSMDNLKAARGHERAAPLLGHKPLGPARLAKLQRDADKLVARYGEPFREDYGWAAAALNKKRPTFADIEEAVQMERFRPYFRLASNTVHAGPKGAVFQLGTMGEDMVLAGASNAGLDEAARLTALSLTQVTSCLLALKPGLDSTIWTGVLIELADKVEAAFVATQRRIERQERMARQER